MINLVLFLGSYFKFVNLLNNILLILFGNQGKSQAFLKPILYFSNEQIIITTAVIVHQLVFIVNNNILTKFNSELPVT